MGRKPFKTPDEKIQVVLSVLRGEMTPAELGTRSSPSVKRDEIATTLGLMRIDGNAGRTRAHWPWG